MDNQLPSRTRVLIGGGCWPNTWLLEDDTPTSARTILGDYWYTCTLELGKPGE